MFNHNQNRVLTVDGNSGDQQIGTPLAVLMGEDGTRGQEETTHLLRTTIRAITSVNPATVNNDAATSKNNLDVLENSRVFRMPIACRTASRNPATTNKVGQSAFTFTGIEHS
jgi:hypothetical protein